MKKVFLVATTLAMALGVGVAVSAHQESFAKAEATVTNGSYRLNVLTNSENWIQDNASMWVCFDGTRRQMNRDTDFPVSDDNSQYSTITIGSDTYSWITLEMDSTLRSGITYDNPEMGRGLTTDGWNSFYPSYPIKTNFKNNTWDNTVILSGTWDNFSTQNYGWYVKVALHTGLDLSQTSYEFMNCSSSPATPNVISGYTFEGWYTDSALTQKWTSGSQYTDINLYAKYEEDAHVYKVTVGSDEHTLVAQNPGAYDAQYKVDVDVTKGDLITFTEDGAALSATADSTNSNNVFVPNNTVLETAEDAALWLKRSGSDWEYWLGGRTTSYFAVNSDNIIALAKNGEKNEYFATNVALAQSSTVKLYASAVTYDGKVKAGSQGVELSAGVITVTEGGNYDIYYEPSEDNYVYFAQLHTYTVKINSASPVALSEVEAGEGYSKQFKATITVAAGNVLSFEKDGEALSVAEDPTNQHNVFVPNHTVIHGGTYDVYLKLDTSDNWSYYLAGRNATYYIYTNNALTPLVPNTNNDDEVYATNVNLVLNNTIKIYETSLTDPALNEFSETGVATVDAGVIKVTKAGTYNLYYNFEEQKLYIGNLSDADRAANAYAELFLDTLSTGESHVCSADGNTDRNSLDVAWASLASSFSTIHENAEVKADAQAILKNADKNADTKVGKFAELYDYIVERYGSAAYNDFANRYNGAVVPGRIAMINPMTNTNSAIVIVVIATTIAALSAGLFIILKKKHQK